MANPCGKTRKLDNPYEIWKSVDGSWEWRVLKKYQEDDHKPNARWFVAVKSPFTFGEFELGDEYAKNVMSQGIKQSVPPHSAVAMAVTG